jgi:L-threonylcarbamoyladenylate synthase
MVLRKDDPGLFAALLPVLRKNLPVILPCDTIYGIVGAAPGAETRIRALKGRTEHKPFLELIPDAALLADYTTQTVPARILAYWPGPLTIIVRRKGLRGNVALRVPQDEFLIRLLTKLGGPLYSTSVNESGRTFLRRIAEIVSAFEKKVEIIVDGGDLPDALPSTIVDLTASSFRLVRQGAAVLPGDLFRENAE